MEEEKEFVKTRAITIEEIKKTMQDHQGKSIKLNSLPNNTHWILKIVKEPTLVHYPGEESDETDEGKNVGYFDVEYKYSNDARIPLRLRVSENCYNKFMTNNKDKEFVGKYALFSKKIFDSKNVQSIGVIYKEGFEPGSGFPNPLELLEEAEQGGSVATPNVSQEIDCESRVDEFIKEAKESILQYNKQMESLGDTDKKVVPSLQLFMVKYFKHYYPKETELIVEAMKK